MPSVIVEVRGFSHRRVEAKIFVCVFTVLMSISDFNAHEDFVRMNVLDRAPLVGPVDEHVIAYLQHGFALLFLPIWGIVNVVTRILSWPALGCTFS